MARPLKDQAGPKSAEAPITREVLAAIADSGLTSYALGKESGVPAEVIRRFVLGDRDIRLATLDRLAGVLGIRLSRISRDTRTRGRPRKA